MSSVCNNKTGWPRCCGLRPASSGLQLMNRTRTWFLSRLPSAVVREAALWVITYNTEQHHAWRRAWTQLCELLVFSFFICIALLAMWQIEFIYSTDWKQVCLRECITLQASICMRLSFLAMHRSNEIQYSGALSATVQPGISTTHVFHFTGKSTGQVK